MPGLEIVNDVSGFLWDEAMAGVCAAAGCGVVLMHTRGRPEEWQTLPAMDPRQVYPSQAGIAGTATDALEAGIQRERIVLDPGFGFGKVSSRITRSRRFGRIEQSGTAAARRGVAQGISG